MKLRIRKVWLALALVITALGLAPAQPTGATAGHPPTAGMGTLLQHQEAGFGLELRLATRMAHQSGLSDDGDRSRRPAAEIRAIQAAAPVKISALVLSSLGMFGVIALHRLTRTF